MGIWKNELFDSNESSKNIIPEKLISLYKNKKDLNGYKIFKSILAMYIILYKKFTNENNKSHYFNCSLKDHLINTGDSILIEHNALQTLNSKGKISGQRVLDSTWSDAKSGEGMNLLGELLMILREHLNPSPDFTKTNTYQYLNNQTVSNQVKELLAKEFRKRERTNNSLY